MSYSFTQFSTLAKIHTTTAREPSINLSPRSYINDSFIMFDVCFLRYSTHSLKLKTCWLGRSGVWTSANHVFSLKISNSAFDLWSSDSNMRIGSKKCVDGTATRRNRRRMPDKSSTPLQENKDMWPHLTFSWINFEAKFFFNHELLFTWWK